MTRAEDLLAFAPQVDLRDGLARTLASGPGPGPGQHPPRLRGLSLPHAYLQTPHAIGGVAIFAWILSHADMASVAGVMGRLGIMGAGAVLLTFGVAMASDVIGWALMFRSVPLSGLWTLRLWLVQMVGEAFNLLTPFGAFGGEPFKALLLNRHYDISYEESTATLILIQTVNSLAQVPFVILGTILMLNADILPEPIEQAILITTIVISVFMVVYIALHGRLLAKLPAKMENSESGARLARAIEFLTDLEERLFHSCAQYARPLGRRPRLRVLELVLGAVEIYFVFWFLDAPYHIRRRLDR